MALIAAMFVVAVGIFVSFFLSSSNQGDSYTITLPGQGSAVIDTSLEIGESNRNQMQIISVDTNNIQAVIASLQRPEQYQCQMEMTYFYKGTQTVLKSQLWKDGDLVRISQQTAEEQTSQQVLLTREWAYLWGEDGAYSRFVRQENDLDLYSRTPSYEDLVTMPREQLLVGEVREMDGQLCLYAETRDDMTGETEQWYVLVENGLLLYAAGSLEGVNTYASRMTGLQLALDDTAAFTLPDGSQPR